jgi:chromosome segregation protein
LEEHRLAEMRENKVRSESAVEQAREAEASLTERIRERLECTPADVLPLGGAGSQRAAAQQGHGRPEAAAACCASARISARSTCAPRSNPTSSTSSWPACRPSAPTWSTPSRRLRQGINSLNREGRERLLAAFELVNGHFETLFTRLFGGGRAHLR